METKNEWLKCCNCNHTFNTSNYINLKAGDPCPECSPEDDPSMGGELYEWNHDIFINVYLVDQAYGGREEGGWWFLCGEPVESRLCQSMTEAQAELTKLNERYVEENKGRRPISSVLSQGEYRVMMEAFFAQPWPQRRPHYE